MSNENVDAANPFRVGAEDVLDRLRRRIASATHWEGCEADHAICAGIKEIEALRANLSRIEAEGARLRHQRTSASGGEAAAEDARDHARYIEEGANALQIILAALRAAPVEAEI